MQPPIHEDQPVDDGDGCAHLILALWMSCLTGIGMLGMDSHVQSARHDVKHGEPSDPAVDWLVGWLIVAIIAIIPIHRLVKGRLHHVSLWMPLVLWLLAYVTVFRVHY